MSSLASFIYLRAQSTWAQWYNGPMRVRGSQVESRRRCEVGVNVAIDQSSGKIEEETEVSEA